MDSYLTESTLKSKQIAPKLLWKLPDSKDGVRWRWAYVKHAEDSLLSLIKEGIRITPHPTTSGFAPVFDAKAYVPDEECSINIEIKYTQGHNLFIECAYGNGKPSGLLTSDSDFYLVVSKDTKNEQSKGKVRLYPTWRLIEYGNHHIEKHGIKSFEASPDSPGSHGFYVNSFAFDEYFGTDAHIWLGDVNCYIDQNQNITYDLTQFTKEAYSPLRQFMREVRMIDKRKETKCNKK